MFPCSRRLVSLLLFIVLSASGRLLYAQAIYVYELPGGSKLITDKKRADPGLKLVKRYDYKSSSRSKSFTSRPRAVDSEFDVLIQQVAKRFGVDAALIKAVMHAESSFQPYAVSHKGAYGLMQLIPDTANRYGVKNLLDPAQNVTGGVRYLKDLLALFNNDTRLALAAYNAGENAVLKFGGVPPYNETEQYVEKVLYLHQLYAAR